MTALEHPDAQQRAHDAIKARIVSVAYRPGQKLRAQQVAQDLGVSRTPVREALGRLASEGLVEKAGGWGFVVRRLSLRDAQEVIEVRTVLELQAGQLALARRTEHDLRRLSLVLDEASQLLAQGQVAAFLQRSRQFHVTIARIGGNHLLASMLDSINDRIQIIGSILVRLFPARAGQVLQENRAIFAALSAGDGTQLEVAIRHHIEQARTMALSDALQFELELTGGLDG